MCVCVGEGVNGDKRERTLDLPDAGEGDDVVHVVLDLLVQEDDPLHVRQRLSEQVAHTRVPHGLLLHRWGCALRAVR